VSGLPELREGRATALALRAGHADEPAVAEAAARILDAVGREGSAAVLRFTAQFDDVRLTDRELQLPAAVLEHARRLAHPGLLERIRSARARAEAFARAQRAALEEANAGGARLRWLPRENVGIYLRRGGRFSPEAVAARFATAKLAGVRRLFAVAAPCGRPTLPGAYGVEPAVLVTAAELGLELHLAGGAQGIAQLGHWVGERGVVVGEAGRYGRAALRQLASTRAVELPASAPALLLADASADPEALANAASTVGVALALDEAAADRLARAAADSELRAFRANRDQAVVFAQALAPSQVMLRVAEPDRWLGELTDAGAILTGAERGIELAAPPLTLFLRQQLVA